MTGGHDVFGYRRGVRMIRSSLEARRLDDVGTFQKAHQRLRFIGVEHAAQLLGGELRVLQHDLRCGCND